MKKIITLILVILLIGSAFSYADFDLQSMATEDLYGLQAPIETEMAKRQQNIYEEINSILVIRREILNQLIDSINSVSDSSSAFIDDNDNLVINNSVFFNTNSADLKPEAFLVLEQIVHVFSRFLSEPEYAQWIDSIMISGHTDSTGTDEINRDLSVARANTILNYLVSTYPDITEYSSYFCAAGYGSSRPIAANATAEGRAQNRRIEISIILSMNAIADILSEYKPEMPDNTLFQDMLGAQTTRYTNSGNNRCSNIRLATSKIDGIVLYPGETFSFNEIVGARTEEAGFLPAPAYAGVGEDGVKDEIGGGACQVSSTLYAATIYAFLETVERTAHIYPVNYIQMGTDATVTIPDDGGQVMDFKFKNSKNYPIKIVGYTEENEEEKCITFEIWGTLEDDDYMPVEFDNSWYWMLDYDRIIEPAYPDRQGYKIKFTHETYAFEDAIGYGSRTLTHREVYKADTGELVLDEIINPRIPSGYAMDTYYSH